MRKHFLKLFTALILLAAMMLSGCFTRCTPDPYLVDRTEGWEPVLTLKVDFSFGNVDANSSALWDEFLDFKPYSAHEYLTEENFWPAAQEAMRLNLGDPHEELRGNTEVINEGGAIGFVTDRFAVVFDRPSGKLLFCADFEKTDCLSRHNSDGVQLTVNAAALDPAQLEEIHKVSGFEFASSELEIKDVSLPLTAQGAFDLSVSMDVKSWGGSTPLASTGGAFYVYYSEVSNAMFVVANTYIQAFDVASGKLLMMSSYGTSGGKVKRPWGEDNSYQLPG